MTYSHYLCQESPAIASRRRCINDKSPRVLAPKRNAVGSSRPPRNILPSMVITRPESATLPLTLGIAKGSIFQHFGSKDGLFFEVYKRAVRSFAKYLDAPVEVRAAGFFEVLRYWLVSTEHLVHEDWIPYRISLLGNYGTDFVLKREINRFLISEDPYGTVSFVRFGLERGELRKDMDIEMIVSIIDWMMERFQDALLTAELDPGFIPPSGRTGRKKGRQNPAVSGRLAAGHR